MATISDSEARRIDTEAKSSRRPSLRAPSKSEADATYIRRHGTISAPAKPTGMDLSERSALRRNAWRNGGILGKAAAVFDGVVDGLEHIAPMGPVKPVRPFANHGTAPVRAVGRSPAEPSATPARAKTGGSGGRRGIVADAGKSMDIEFRPTTGQGSGDILSRAERIPKIRADIARRTKEELAKKRAEPDTFANDGSLVVARASDTRFGEDLLRSGRMHDRSTGLVSGSDPTRAKISAELGEATGGGGKLAGAIETGGHRDLSDGASPATYIFKRSVLSPKNKSTKVIVGGDLDLWAPDFRTRIGTGMPSRGLRAKLVNDDLQSRASTVGLSLDTAGEVVGDGVRSFVNPKAIPAGSLATTRGFAKVNYEPTGSETPRHPYSEAYVSGEVPVLGKNGTLHRVVIEQSKDPEAASRNRFLAAELRRRGVDAKLYGDFSLRGNDIYGDTWFLDRSIYSPPNLQSTFADTALKRYGLVPSESSSYVKHKMPEFGTYLETVPGASYDSYSAEKSARDRDAMEFYNSLSREQHRLDYAWMKGKSANPELMDPTVAPISTDEYVSGMSRLGNKLLDFYGISRNEFDNARTDTVRALKDASRGVEFKTYDDALMWAKEGAEFQQDAKGGEARAASKGSEKPHESTAPTDEQIAEALEFLRMFREREQPTNDWEASALDRLEQLVSAAARTRRGPERSGPLETGMVDPEGIEPPTKGL